MKNPEQFASPEAEKKYGLNVHAVLEFGRHEVPGKTPDGMSADYLTDEGKQNAAQRGSNIREKNAAAYASPKERAQETVDLEMQSAEIFSEGGVNVVNKKLEDMPENLEVQDQKEGNQFKVKIVEELEAIPDFKKIMPAAKKWAQEQSEAGSEKDVYDLIVEFYLENTNLCEKEGVLTPHEAAVEIGFRVAREVGMTEKFLNDTEIRLVNITHGPKLEPFLLEVIEKFKTLDDLGEALRPGESFELEVETDSEGKKEIKLKFRGKSYEVDEKALDKLADEYKAKIRPQRKKRAEEIGQKFGSEN